MQSTEREQDRKADAKKIAEIEARRAGYHEQRREIKREGGRWRRALVEKKEAQTNSEGEIS